MNNQLVTKVCSKCKDEKTLSEFCKHKRKKDGLNNACKICCKERNKQYKLKNPDKVRQCVKNWKLMHKDKTKLYKKQYDLNNKNKINKQRNKHRKQRMKIDSGFKIHDILRSRMKQALKSQGIKKCQKTLDCLGCTAIFYQNYLQSLFKPGMTLENKEIRKWEQHHIKYCSTFDLSDPKQQQLCFHYTNVVPLWKDEHRKLHAKDSL
jgi:hypothetical protein